MKDKQDLDSDIQKILISAPDLYLILNMQFESVRRAQEIEQANIELAKHRSKLKRRNKQLRHSREKLRMLLNGARDYAIIFLDTNGNVITWNTGAEKIIGYKATEIIGKHFSEFYTQEDRQRDHPEHELQQVRATGRYEEEGWRIRANGEKFWAFVTLSALYDEKGNLAGFGKITRDLTEQKRNEVKIAELNNQLMLSAKQAGMAEVANAVLHNIGNVLNSINTSIKLIHNNLVRSRFLPELKTVTALIQQHATTLSEYLSQDAKGKLISEYLTEILNLVESENASTIDEIMNLNKHAEFITDIISQQHTFTGSSIFLEQVSVDEIIDYAIKNIFSGTSDILIQKETDKTPLFKTDKYKLLQIIICLVQNAKEALVRASQPQKWLKISIKKMSEDSLNIIVQDNGVGISSVDIKNIFSLGFTTKKDGHGIGLHNSALLARELGGSLHAISQGEGLGAMFTLKLPVDKFVNS